MAVQNSEDQIRRDFVTFGETRVRDSETVAQDAGRATALAQYTLMYRNPSTRKWGPLTSIDPVLTSGKMVCGAMGATEATMAAITDGEFEVTVDGLSIDVTGLDFSVIDSLLDTSGKMVCGAFGATKVTMAAISDGEFRVSIDGTQIDVTGLDFTDMDSLLDTPATCTCGAIGTNLGGFQAITDGDFRITINGVQHDITTLDWSEITALDELVDPINVFAVPLGFRAEYDSDVDIMSFITLATGQLATISYLSDTGGAGTDMSAAGFLNGITGTATLVQGTGGAGWETSIADIINANSSVVGKFRVEWDGSAYTFLSPTRGTLSIVTVLSDPSAGGTDISGASHLNGLTGTGTATAGTGGAGWESTIADVINAAAAGRFRVEYSGTVFTFLSPTLGIGSSVAVLTAVSGGSGTDISGASHLNGLTGTGTATAGTGGQGEDIPAGFYMGAGITAAEMVAGDVTLVPILVGGTAARLNSDMAVFENSLTLNSVIHSKQKTIGDVLHELGLFFEDMYASTAYEN